MGQFNCTAAGVVYVTTCQPCYKLYIGETGRRLPDRLGEHLRSVEGFKQDPATREVGCLWPNTSTYLNTNKSMTCEDLVPRLSLLCLPSNDHGMQRRESLGTRLDMRVFVARQERRNGKTTAREKATHFPARYTSPHGLAQKQGAAQYLSIALTPLYARA